MPSISEIKANEYSYVEKPFLEQLRQLGWTIMNETKMTQALHKRLIINYKKRRNNRKKDLSLIIKKEEIIEKEEVVDIKKDKPKKLIDSFEQDESVDRNFELYWTKPLEEEKIDFIDILNKERKERNLSQLKYNNILNQAAQSHVEYIRKTKVFSHTWENNSKVLDRVKSIWFTGEYVWENINWWNYRAEWVFNSWMHSEWHKANMINPNYNQIWLWFDDGIWCLVLSK